MGKTIVAPLERVKILFQVSVFLPCPRPDDSNPRSGAAPALLGMPVPHSRLHHWLVMTLWHLKSLHETAAAACLEVRH